MKSLKITLDDGKYTVNTEGEVSRKEAVIMLLEISQMLISETPDELEEVEIEE